MTFGPSEWRARAETVDGIEAALWCAIGSDGALHPKRSGRIAVPLLAYAGGAGGGHSNWLGSMAAFLGIGAHRYAARNGEAGVALSEEDFARVLAGDQLPTLRASRWDLLEGRSDLRRPMPLTQCRWDADLWTDHAAHGKEPAKDRVLQDQTVNALAAIGLASCPSAPMRRGLSTPMVVSQPARGETHLAWPLWTIPLRASALEAVLAAEPQRWRPWPIARARRWTFARGTLVFEPATLREPVGSADSWSTPANSTTEVSEGLAE